MSPSSLIFSIAKIDEPLGLFLALSLVALVILFRLLLQKQKDLIDEKDKELQQKDTVIEKDVLVMEAIDSTLKSILLYMEKK